MSWNLKDELNAFAEKINDNSKNIEVRQQKTSYVNHVCYSCKKNIPSGRPLIRETERIISQYSENPIWKSKYFCDEQCYGKRFNPIKIKKEKEEQIFSLPKGFEIINGPNTTT